LTIVLVAVHVLDSVEFVDLIAWHRIAVRAIVLYFDVLAELTVVRSSCITCGPYDSDALSIDQADSVEQ